ncbi:MAG: hypothetical protein JWN37_873 [Candidatus Nomurabacteria bacterium]|nr:hypothetical protein [Candidatus Nomurabacteria bacterium]
MKAIIFAGGKGTRIHEITGSVVPKSLARLNAEFPRILISYQLYELEKAGFKKVLIVFQEDWQVQIFLQSYKLGEVPKLEYTFFNSKHSHVLCAFKNVELIRWIDGSDFLVTYGDVFCDAETFRSLINLSKKNNTTAICRMFSKSERWQFNNKFLSFMEDEDNRIIKYEFKSLGSFTIHAPVLFQNRALDRIIKLINNTQEPRSISLYLDLIDNNELSTIDNSCVQNMNTYEDVPKILELIRKYQQDEGSK